MTDGASSLPRASFDRVIARAGGKANQVADGVLLSVAWVGCASLAFTRDRFHRRAPSPRPLAAAPTA
jgi:hypothetical protein